MQVLKFKKQTDSRVQLANLTVDIYCLMNNIKINKTTSLILSYCMVYGFGKSLKDLLLRSKILENPVSIDNVFTKLRKLELIKKNDIGKDVLCDELNFQIQGKLGFIIKLENV